MKRFRVTKDHVKEFIIMNIGTIFVAGSFFFFKEPNNLTMGGIAGLSIIVHALVPAISVGTFVAIANIGLLLIGFIFLGKKMGGETVYCSLLYTAVIWLLDYFLEFDESITGDIYIDICLCVLIGAVGAALLFNVAATTGGTDIISMILKKYTKLNISFCMLIADSAIALGAVFVYGWKIALYSFLGLIAHSLVVRIVIDNMNLRKQVSIITEKPKEICQYINLKLNRGATYVAAHGAFTGKDKYMVITVLSNSQALDIKRAIKQIDKNAFLMITNTTDIIGKGFRTAVLDFAEDKKGRVLKKYKEIPIEPKDE